MPYMLKVFAVMGLEFVVELGFMPIENSPAVCRKFTFLGVLIV